MLFEVPFGDALVAVGKFGESGDGVLLLLGCGCHIWGQTFQEQIKGKSEQEGERDCRPQH